MRALAQSVARGLGGSVLLQDMGAADAAENIAAHLEKKHGGVDIVVHNAGITRDGMLHMMFKLGKCAEKSWRKLRGFAHLADVIQGVDFVNGIKPSTTDQAAA